MYLTAWQLIQSMGRFGEIQTECTRRNSLMKKSVIYTLRVKNGDYTTSVFLQQLVEFQHSFSNQTSKVFIYYYFRSIAEESFSTVKNTDV
jgi:hypothetical protein